MANGRRDTERCTGERRRHLRDKLLLRIGVRSKPAVLVAVQPTAVSRPMAKLVERGAIPIDRFMKCGLRRPLQEIMARAGKGHAAAAIDARAVRGGHRTERKKT